MLCLKNLQTKYKAKNRVYRILKMKKEILNVGNRS